MYPVLHSLFNVCEVILFSIVTDGVLTSRHLILDKIGWVKRESLRCALRCSLWVWCHVIFIELLLGEFTDEGNWISTPDLSTKDSPSWRDHRVGKNNCTTLDTGTLSNYSACSNDTIIVNDATVDLASSFDNHVLSNVGRAGNAMWQCMECINHCTITDRSEVTDAYGVHLSSDRDIVPNGGPLRHYNVTDKAGIRSNPSILHLRSTCIKGHLLTMARGFLEVSYIVGPLTSHAIEL